MSARDRVPPRRSLRLGAAIAVATLTLAEASGAHAQSLTPPTGLRVPPARLGYAFDYPPILLRQRLFGLAHGTSLLAAACLDLPARASATEEAYATWRQGQDAAIRGLAADLAAWYFGPRATEAEWADIARAIGLRDALGPMPENALDAACATLPAALGKPRYDFATMIAGEAAGLAASTEANPQTAVPPSLTFGDAGTPQPPPSLTFGDGGVPSRPSDGQSTPAPR